MSPPSPDPSKPLVAPALFAAVVAISFAAIFFRKAEPTHPLVAAGIRLAVAAVLLSPFTVRAAVKGRFGRDLLLRSSLAGLAYALHFGAWVTSLTLTSVAASVTLVTTNPLLLALAGVITGRDRPRRGLWLSIALAFAGLLMIGGRDLSLGMDVLAGDALALLGALAMSIYLLIGRSIKDKLDPLAFSGVATGVGAVVLLGIAWIAGIPIEAASTEAFAYLVLAAVLPQVVGHNLLTWSLKHTTPTVVAMAIVGEPVGAAILGVIWLGEGIGLLVGSGCAVTLIAVILAIGLHRAQSDQTLRG